MVDRPNPVIAITDFRRRTEGCTKVSLLLSASSTLEELDSKAMRIQQETTALQCRYLRTESFQSESDLVSAGLLFDREGRRAPP